MVEHLGEIVGRLAGAARQQVIDGEAQSRQQALPLLVAQRQVARVLGRKTAGLDQKALAVAGQLGRRCVVENARVAGNQHDDEQRLLAGVVGARRENALALVAQLVQIAGQALVTDDVRHRGLLQMFGAGQNLLLIVGKQGDHDAEEQRKHRRQQRKGHAGAQPLTGGALGHDG